MSHYKSVAVRRFGTAARPDIAKKHFETPGPGTYRPPSDFGYVKLTRKYVATVRQPQMHNHSIEEVSVSI